MRRARQTAGKRIQAGDAGRVIRQTYSRVEARYARLTVGRRLQARARRTELVADELDRQRTRLGARSADEDLANLVFAGRGAA